MGALYNSNANIVYQIVNWIGVIAGIACTAMIVYSCIKIFFSDEGEKNRYIKRIKNGVIALILIISISEVVRVVSVYFKPDKNNTSIGNFDYVKTTMKQSVAETKKDKKDRNIIIIDGELYVKVYDDMKVGFNGSWSKQIIVDCYKRYDDCQGVTGGKVADDAYYVFRYENVDGWGAFKGGGDEGYKAQSDVGEYIISAYAVKNTKVEDDEGLREFLKNNASKRGSLNDDGTATGWYVYDTDSNPYAD